MLAAPERGIRGLSRALGARVQVREQRYKSRRECETLVGGCGREGNSGIAGENDSPPREISVGKKRVMTRTRTGGREVVIFFVGERKTCKLLGFEIFIETRGSKRHVKQKVSCTGGAPSSFLVIRAYRKIRFLEPL